MSRFSVESFLSHSRETFRWGTLLCCVSEKFWYRKSIWIRGRGKYQDFLQKFFVSVPKKTVGEPFSLSLISGIEKVWMRGWGGGGGVVSRFSVKNSRLTVPKNFAGQPFRVSLISNFGHRNILCFTGLCHDFLSKFFCLTEPKIFVGEPFSVSLISGIEKVWMRGWVGGGGSVKIFRQKFSSHSAEKFRRATL